VLPLLEAHASGSRLLRVVSHVQRSIRAQTHPVPRLTTLARSRHPPSCAWEGVPFHGEDGSGATCRVVATLEMPSTVGDDGLLPFDPAGITPETLQRIELSWLGLEYVNDDVAEVD